LIATFLKVLSTSDENFLSAEDLTKLEEAISTGDPTIITTAIKSIESLNRTFREYLLHELDNDCKNICLRSEPSELRTNTFCDMIGFEWQKLSSEMSKWCSFLLDFLLTVMNTTKEKCDEIIPRLGLCYVILMQTRNRDLSSVQRLNTVFTVKRKGPFWPQKWGQNFDPRTAPIKWGQFGPFKKGPNLAPLLEPFWPHIVGPI
jgi:hypothetical protein